MQEKKLIKIGKNGEITLPEEMMNAAGLKKGDTTVFKLLDNGNIKLTKA